MKLSQIKSCILCCIVATMIFSCANDDDVNSSNIPGIHAGDLSNATTQLIVDWNTLWLELDRYTENMRPNSTARALAYIHLAGYETAVMEMDGYSSNKERLADFNINFENREDNVDLNVALNTTYALVIDHFMFSVSNNAKTGIVALQNEKANEIAQNLTDDEIQNSVNWGTYVANSVIAFSQTDMQAESQIVDPNPSSYEAPVGDGLWVAAEGESAWFPYWDEVRTFVVSPDETSSMAPPFEYSTESSSNCYGAMSEVNTIATTALQENNEDLWIAEFWSDDVEGLMMSPVGRQFSIANQLIAQEDLAFEETLALLLKLGFAINDAAVSAWDDKYTYNTQRPSGYITANINEDFTTNLARFISSPNPAFPSYPSGHATFAGVSAGVFIDFFGTDSIDFTDRSHEGRTAFNGEPRSFTSFTELAQENAYSRVPLGVHVQADSDEGIRLGFEIADAVNDFNLSN